jgi:hypothetical protein
MAARKRLSINAHQLIYSRAEPKPFIGLPNNRVKKGGFQVVYHSPAIADDVPTIEPLVQCFQPATQDSVRLQFFRTPSGRYCVSYTAPIDPDPEITDPNQRGAFLVHCLVFEAAEFSRLLGNNPFPVLFHGKTADGDDIFINDARSMLEVVRADQALVEIYPNQEVIKKQRAAHTPREFGVENAKKVFELSLGQLKDKSLNFVGEPYDIEDVLNLAFSLADHNTRANMSFSTFVDKCNPAPGAFWAVGTQRRISSTGFLPIDLSNPDLTLPPDTRSGETPDPKGAGYGSWLKRSLADSSLAQTLAKAPTVQLIARAFEEGQAIAQGQDPVAAREYYDVNRGAVHENLKIALSNLLSPALTHEMLKSIEAGETVGESGFHLNELLDAAAQKRFIHPNSIAEQLYRWLVRKPYPKARQESETFQALAEKTSHGQLRLVAALTAKTHLSERVVSLIKRAPSKRDLARHAALDVLSDNGILSTTITDLSAYDWASPNEFVTPATAKEVERYYLQNPPTHPNDIVNLLDALAGAGSNLRDAIPLLETIKAAGKGKKLKPLLKEHAASLAPDFTAAAEALTQ